MNDVLGSKPVEFFATAATNLGQRQLELRDKVIDAALNGKYDDAALMIKDLQIVQSVISLCHQTILKQAEATEANIKLAAAEEKRLAKGAKA